jgi:hypothetical protein
MSMGWLHPYPYPTGANPRQTSLLTPGYPRTIYVRARSIDVFSSQNRSIDLLFSFVATVILCFAFGFSCWAGPFGVGIFKLYTRFRLKLQIHPLERFSLVVTILPRCAIVEVCNYTYMCDCRHI